MFETWFPRHWTTLKKLIWLRMTALGNAIKTVTGAIVTFVTSKAAPLINLTATLDPIQDLHGQDAPYPAGGGKQLIPYPYADNRESIAGVSVTYNSDGSVKLNGTTSGSLFVNLGNGNPAINNITLDAGSYTLSKTGVSGLSLVAVKDGSYWFASNATSDNTQTISQQITAYFYLTAAAGVTFNNAVVYPQCEKGSTATSFAPYSNICPISGHTGVTVHVADGENPHVVDNEYPITFPETVYGGTDEVMSGQGLSEWVKIVFDGSPDEIWNPSDSATPVYYAIWNNPASVSNSDLTQLANWVKAGGNEYQPFGAFRAQTNGAIVVGNLDNNVQGAYHFATREEFKAYLAEHNLEICYKVATPTTFTHEPQQITTLKGQNTIWVDDSDNISVTYRE